MITFPNCKINLGLYITEKRDDGYHNIESVFVPVPLCDVLEILTINDLLDKNILVIDNLYFKITGIELEGSIHENICVKAFQLLRSVYNLPPTAIYLRKNIPSGAGLGGGSADGTFVLRLLNELYQLKITPAQLKEYASKLGSDCPFFIENKTAFVTGRGEIIQTIPFELKGLHIIIIKPDLHISTKEAYSNITPAMPIYSLQKSLSMPIEEWKNTVTNDFEKALQKLYPQLDKIKKDLYNAGAIYASMSGSGSSIYGLSKTMLTIPDSLKSHFCWQGIL